MILSEGNVEPIKNYASELDLNTSISFVGPSKAAEVAEYLQKSDCLVLFSNYENMPVVISEAWMCGIPVISTAVGGISENLKETNGILVNPGDELALTLALEKVFSTHKTYAKALIYKEASEKFSSKSIGNDLFGIYSTLFSK